MQYSVRYIAGGSPDVPADPRSLDSEWESLSGNGTTYPYDTGRHTPTQTGVRRGDSRMSVEGYSAGGRTASSPSTASTRAQSVSTCSAASSGATQYAVTPLLEASRAQESDWNDAV